MNTSLFVVKTSWYVIIIYEASLATSQQKLPHHYTLNDPFNLLPAYPMTNVLLHCYFSHFHTQHVLQPLTAEWPHWKCEKYLNGVICKWMGMQAFGSMYHGRQTCFVCCNPSRFTHWQRVYGLVLYCANWNLPKNLHHFSSKFVNCIADIILNICFTYW